ncbi:MAG: multifunctional CCA tRNA nucleotidyl transferase/2'3'-cyclic phosphodiesterase/2'nucleotidase/phosphatase [Betaproteobacteria bacterium RIFCSPLOWO2_02_FULL_67_26]|nr:MAG: multifunctional CCA tRNA nucleotidyl transferase/2'3'-cyclic phosphodiesterase/2'nucleotidase/phosphatase [Betaproteobacteria bacterium RIFCSPLOWO2_02_FULL_67_26]
MKIYCVGGAVRDELLGLPVKDRDYVVVGATPEEMVQQGYKPVGRDFPVFLHPQSHEEYALARTERKTARGYHGFEFRAAPDVTLEQDLARRDLTINAIARDAEGRLIDPHHGGDDLKAGVLRHVSAAFAEDPVRVLRVARFAARFGFRIARETMKLMREMARDGEVDALVPERVWQEIARGLMESRPSGLFEVLRECRALERVMPEVDALWDDADTARTAMAALDAAAAAGATLPARFATLARHLVPLAAESLASRLKVPADCRDLALLAARHANTVLDAVELDAQSVLELFNTVDAWRRPERFAELMAASFAGEPDAGPARAHLERALRAAAGVDAGEIAKAAKDPAAIRGGVDAARLDAIRKALTDR